MAFSLPSQQPPLLFVASDHSSIHVFRLDKAGVKHAAAAAVAKTMLSSVIPRNPPRKGAKVMKIKLPCKKGTALACGVRPSTQDAANEDGTVRVAVVSTEGILYIYAISDLMGHPTASLEGESVVN